MTKYSRLENKVELMQREFIELSEKFFRLELNDRDVKESREKIANLEGRIIAQEEILKKVFFVFEEDE